MYLHATQYGQASASEISTPTIILHGLFGSYRNWHPIARALSDKHLVYSLDLRNHGQSPHAEVMDYPHMAEDVLKFIQDKLEQTPSVNIIAHSMGGKVAMWLALTHPEVVKKLVVVDIAPVSYAHDFSDVLNGFKSIPLHLIKSRQDADGYLSQIIDDSSLRQFLLQNLQFKAGKYRWRLNLEVIAQSISTLTDFPQTINIEPFRKRVIFVGGGQSGYLSKVNQKQTKALFPSASFSMIKSAGHWLHAEQPELFKALIQPYLYSD
ncbi:MAG: alpha/beta fold hydrolase [gamma proteobacterium symbiont of Bathyaustriella thionipta]|nr:alpha/beta fold hydrolase [gamma proteobacterium symbiont of Bathyaustriella thionipta]MCU7949402.1 alpha/beta fold hydrolase [gamma proteobacterium symbiont of Bathyaustriella thionipta]MCU7953607.1 alpha/beta fold hydrolase [gamma proteobacterium symbiont of Bathyaustriella thionipta]MCU7956256.1 alpha/beta fold hydrolase [gamma proteobacterium symbiont of Bathyaustriella thionipta]MCU7965988.1 alpha/beta fold hydrolase [gamma proteobacterium symbiont of Bathyaustriella thionipta]